MGSSGSWDGSAISLEAAWSSRLEQASGQDTAHYKTLFLLVVGWGVGWRIVGLSLKQSFIELQLLVPPKLSPLTFTLVGAFVVGGL